MAYLISTDYYLSFVNFLPPILKCIVKETELLFELLLSDDDVETTEMTALSKQVRQTALELILCRGPESAAVAGAMVVCSLNILINFCGIYSFCADRHLVTNYKTIFYGVWRRRLRLCGIC